MADVCLAKPVTVAMLMLLELVIQHSKDTHTQTRHIPGLLARSWLTLQMFTQREWLDGDPFQFSSHFCTDFIKQSFNVWASDISF